MSDSLRSIDCNLTGSSVHEILQARILKWVAIPFSRGSSPPRDGAWVSCLAGRFFTIWLTRKTQHLFKTKSIKLLKTHYASFGRTDAEAETPILWPPHVKSWLVGKDPDAGRDWGQEEKGTTEDEMAGWHHRLDGHEFEWTPGVGDGQGGLACCDSWGRRVGHDWATELNWTDSFFS